MNNILQYIKNLYAKQTAWLILVTIITALFVYAEFTGTRLFFSQQVDDWKPSNSRGGHGSSHSNIHHK
jgi:hypothetical protein